MGGLFSPLAGEGMMQIGMFINFPYLITFMMLTWAVNKVAKSKSIKKRFKSVRVRSFTRSLVVGILLAGLFFIANEIHTWLESLRYVVTMLIAQFILWGGIRDIMPTIAKNYNTIMEPFRKERYNDYERRRGEYEIENSNDNE